MLVLRTVHPPAVLGPCGEGEDLGHLVDKGAVAGWGRDHRRFLCLLVLLSLLLELELSTQVTTQAEATKERSQSLAATFALNSTSWRCGSSVPACTTKEEGRPTPPRTASQTLCPPGRSLTWKSTTSPSAPTCHPTASHAASTKAASAAAVSCTDPATAASASCSSCSSALICVTSSATLALAFVALPFVLFLVCGARRTDGQTPQHTLSS